MNPKKELGQHWLYDDKILAEICREAAVRAGETVVEVGPGLGTLTHKLLRVGAAVIAIEFDSDLAKGLKKSLREDFSLTEKDLERLTIIEQDIRTYDFTRLPTPYKVVANIPYYLTSNLLRLLGELQCPPERAVLLIQKEVAERVCALPGDMSLLSIATQLYFECKKGCIVPAALFFPAPKVDSQILCLQRRAMPLVLDEEKKAFFQVVKAGFSERRKKLRSSLSGGLRLEKTQIDELLAKAAIASDARAQELSIEQWKRLSRCLVFPES
jgi:16S rRNA (adenine1518-N6/adenine1519-N6)-dimethyltransferase